MIPDKINLSEICSAHLGTLRVIGTERLSKSDLLLFFVVPALFAILISYLMNVTGASYLNTIIAVYAIFSALLINAQVALYTIFRSWPEIPTSAQDAKKTKNQDIRETKNLNSRALVREVNANLSYLTVISAFALVLSFAFSVAPIRSSIELFVSLFLFLHFFLTLLMAVKRIYRLFDAEFQS